VLASCHVLSSPSFMSPCHSMLCGLHVGPEVRARRMLRPTRSAGVLTVGSEDLYFADGQGALYPHQLQEHVLADQRSSTRERLGNAFL
jgi:hypothetical protein